jgi:hypothetical protein
MQRSAVQILPELSTAPFVDISAEQQAPRHRAAARRVGAKPSVP